MGIRKLEGEEPEYDSWHEAMVGALGNKSANIETALARQENIRNSVIPPGDMDKPVHYMNIVLGQNAVVESLCPGGGKTDYTVVHAPLTLDTQRVVFGASSTPPEIHPEWVSKPRNQRLPK